MGKKLACQECGSTEDVIRGLCEECESEHVWCDCCKGWQSCDEPCRHVFWTDCGWGGAGSNETPHDTFKPAFFAFLDAMTGIEKPRELDDYPDLVTGIEKEVRKHAFWTRREGFMLSTPDLLFYRLRPDLPKHKDEVQSLHFARITPDQIPERDGDVAEGFEWLQSLCADETRRANRLTVAWIREWRTGRKSK